MTEQERRRIAQAHAAATIALYAHLKKNGWGEDILTKMCELLGMHKVLMEQAAEVVPEDAPSVTVHEGISA